MEKQNGFQHLRKNKPFQETLRNKKAKVILIHISFRSALPV